MMFDHLLRVSLGLAVGVAALTAQQQNPAAPGQNQLQSPTYRVNVVDYVDRTTTAVNYEHRSGATKIDFAGTPLLPDANGEAKVESKQGYTEIEVEFDDLKPATNFGPEYLTYVMWAITPEGRATNLGEIQLNGNRGKLNVTTEFQSFAMLITAEPHFAVAQPSNVVVIENVVRSDTGGKIETAEARFQLLERGVYSRNTEPIPDQKVTDKNPLEFLQADNTIRMARAVGASQFAADTLDKAVQQKELAQRYMADSKKTPAIQAAREATQTAADARLIALRGHAEAALTEERQQAERKNLEANQTAMEAQLKALQEAEARRNAEDEARRLQAQQADAIAGRQAAETAKAEAEAARQYAEREAQFARQALTKAEQERADLRNHLQQQLNQVLATEQSNRGLIVNLTDVLFEPGSATLAPSAREKLSKIAGILVAHPGLTLHVDGHTDSTGPADENQQLSDARASAARDYLVSQGVRISNIATRGFGETEPAAPNQTPDGRQQNRRVELVVSGDAIAQNR